MKSQTVLNETIVSKFSFNIVFDSSWRDLVVRGRLRVNLLFRPRYENWERRMDWRKLFSSECLVSTTADGDKILRIRRRMVIRYSGRLSIVVYHVHQVISLLYQSSSWNTDTNLKVVRNSFKTHLLVEKSVVKKNWEMNTTTALLPGNCNNQTVLNHPGFNP